MINRVLAAISLAALLAVGGGAWYLKKQIAAVATLKQANAQLHADARATAAALARNQAVLQKRERSLKTVNAELATTQRSLSEALRTNKEWSDTDVPTDVQKSLSGLSGASRGLSEDGPGGSAAE